MNFAATLSSTQAIRQTGPSEARRGLNLQYSSKHRSKASLNLRVFFSNLYECSTQVSSPEIQMDGQPLHKLARPIVLPIRPGVPSVHGKCAAKVLWPDQERANPGSRKVLRSTQGSTGSESCYVSVLSTTLVSCASNTLTIVASATAPISRSDDESMLPHRRGGATKKAAPSRRNPPGRWGLRDHLGVARRRRCHHIDSSSLLDLASQAPSAIVNVLEGQDTRTPLSDRSESGGPSCSCCR